LFVQSVEIFFHDLISLFAKAISTSRRRVASMLGAPGFSLTVPPQWGHRIRSRACSLRRKCSTAASVDASSVTSTRRLPSAIAASAQFSLAALLFRPRWIEGSNDGVVVCVVPAADTEHAAGIAAHRDDDLVIGVVHFDDLCLAGGLG